MTTDPKETGSHAGVAVGINPDGTPDETMLERVTTTIVAAADPERIILFGSAARGEMTARSDLDVLVVKDGDHYRQVSRRIHMALPARTPPVHVVVASSRDVERHRHKPYYVIQAALRDGRVLYERTHRPPGAPGAPREASAGETAD